MRLAKLIMKAHVEETKERLIQGAFIGKQLGAGGDMSFQQYLASLGLWDSPTEPSPPQMDAKAAIAKAEGILKRARESK